MTEANPAPLLQQADQNQLSRSLPVRRANGHRVLRAFGLGLITGAADDDPSAIGTYASAGAQLGPGFLWTAPVTFPMMVAVVYLCSKLGQVTGEGLFAGIRRHYSKSILYTLLAGVLIGNTIEAGADLGGMAAAINMFVPVRLPWLVVGITVIMILLQIWASYTLIRNIFRWLALVLLAYVGAAVFAKPDIVPVVRGTFIPTIHFTKEYLAMLVAVIGTTLSAYLYSWQSNEEVEEKLSVGRRRLSERRGTTDEELKQSAWDVTFGMFFSNIIMYFIILSTAATLFKAGKTNINSAAEAALALRPMAGSAAQALFAIGIIAVGFLAVPVMTTGAAYDLCQSFGWKYGLSRKPKEAKVFYVTILVITLLGMGFNFLHLNPIKALVWAGIVQGFSTPFLMLITLRITNNPKIVGDWKNTRLMNGLAWITTIAIFAAGIGLVVSWIL